MKQEKKKWCRKYKSPIGNLMIVTDGEALTELLLEKEVKELNLVETGWIELRETWENRTRAEYTEQGGPSEILALAEEWLDRYFDGEFLAAPVLAGKKVACNSGYQYSLDVGERNIILCPEGTEFRQEVWRLLCEIPYGQTMTYGDIAKRMAVVRGRKKMSAQAVGGAVGQNPIAIMIPCHRVIGAGNKLVGFGGGLLAKERLLETEGIGGFR